MDTPPSVDKTDQSADPDGLPGRIRPSLAVTRDVALIGAVAIWGLWAGSGFLVPLVVALLLFVLIIAVADRAQELVPMPGWVASLLGAAVVMAGLSLVFYILASQATSFVRVTAGYETEIDDAMHRLAALLGNELAAFLRDTIVEIDMGALARSSFGGVTFLFNSFMLIVLYIGFLLAERLAFRHKIAMAAASPLLGAELTMMTDAISVSLQRYVGVKTFVSAVTAGISYAVFRFLGLEFPETWAVLTFALNFIPSIGSIIAVIFPALVALLQFETLTPFIIIVLGCGTIQFVIGNFVDPAMLGRTLNMSTFMVMVALTFWSTLWGVIGAFLSVPVTVCILIVMSHVPGLRPVAILMSQDGRLESGPPRR
ncbi:AI-2E family transporter [Lutimaribacter marinistellae]|uniref:AI-2E family transporter n=1 Tax=Lutimaribacter marinistellae TaxID=1820329 RepID=A0ABV7TMH6_9RHOB